MILKNTELSTIVSNCLAVKNNTGNKLEFVRLTDKQIEIYDKEGFGIAARANACVCIDFAYNGRTIAFDFNPLVIGSRKFLSIDLYEDEKMVYTLSTLPGPEGQRKFYYEFADKKERRIRIFLPLTCGIEIYDFTVDDGSAFVPTSTEGRKKILFLGDSITHGYDAYFTSMSYAAAIVRHYDAVCLNQAIAGYRFNADVLDEELDFEPDAIIVAYGTNDWGRFDNSEEQFRTASKTYIDKLCKMYPDKKIFGILPLWRHDKERRSLKMPFAKMHEILTEYYSEHGNVTVIDGRNAVPNTSEFYTDGLHPNSIGQLVYAQYVIDAMEKAGFHK